MGRVRPFTPDDIDEIATLHREGFLRHVLDGPSEDHHSYFRAVFFENPWRDLGPPSLVFEDGGGSLVGFLGVVPRRLRLGDEPIVAAVSTQFIVRPDGRSQLAGIALMKAFLSGDQDLSIADEGNDDSRRIWERMGGSTLALPSVSWSKALRPARHFLTKVESRKRLGWARLLRPAAVSWDAAMRMDASPLAIRPPDGVTASPLDAAALHRWLTTIRPQPPIRPVYAVADLQWLLSRYGHAPGVLERRSVHRADGAWLGCYLYCRRPDGRAEVLYCEALPDAEVPVFQSMLADAYERGAILIWGKTTPGLIRPLAQSRCGFHEVQRWTLVASRRADVRSVLDRGDTGLTRLEGEYPTAFHV